MKNKTHGGAGTVFLRKTSSVYYFKFDQHGKPVCGSTGRRTEREARSVLMEKIALAVWASYRVPPHAGHP